MFLKIWTKAFNSGIIMKIVLFKKKFLQPWMNFHSCFSYFKHGQRKDFRSNPTQASGSQTALTGSVLSVAWSSPRIRVPLPPVAP